MKNLVIVGGGPRGLAIALRASQHIDKLNIYVVDPDPISTWKFPNMLPEMEMRSPITFDLVTYQRDLQQYSLASFLKKDVIAESQIDVEFNTTFCQRKEFVKYLKYVIVLLSRVGVSFVPRRTLAFSDTFITTDKGDIPYDYLVLAAGKATQKDKCPKYLKGKTLLTTDCLFDCGWKDKVVNVVGSGQQSAEVVNYLCSQKAKVYWLQKHEPRVHQYPVPSFKEWGISSALGPYYSKTSNDRDEYLRKVKQWGPTITPYISNLLKHRKYTVISNPRNTDELDMTGEFFLATGYTNDVALIDNTLSLNKNRNNTYLPDIVDSFQSSSHPNIYFTGSLAAHFDGPRQGSIISSGLTARTILLSILKNYG